MYTIDDSGKMVEILRAEELSQKVYTTIRYYEDRAAAANEKAKLTLEEAKTQVANSYEEENKHLKERLKYSWGEFASEKEYSAYQDFVKRHMHLRETSKAQGGMQPYIIPYYHGLGCSKSVVCQICGQEEDITDTEVW